MDIARTWRAAGTIFAAAITLVPATTAGAVTRRTPAPIPAVRARSGLWVGPTSGPGLGTQGITLRIADGQVTSAGVGLVTRCRPVDQPSKSFFWRVRSDTAVGLSRSGTATVRFSATPPGVVEDGRVTIALTVQNSVGQARVDLQPTPGEVTCDRVVKTFAIKWVTAATAPEGPVSDAGPSEITPTLDLDTRTITRLRLRIRGMCISDELRSAAIRDVDTVVVLGPISYDAEGNFAGTSGLDSSGRLTPDVPETNAGSIRFHGRVVGNRIVFHFNAGFRLADFPGPCVAGGTIEA